MEFKIGMPVTITWRGAEYPAVIDAFVQGDRHPELLLACRIAGSDVLKVIHPSYARIVSAPEHDHDWDCTVWRGVCIECGVSHEGYCEECGGTAFHNGGCSQRG